MRIVTVSREFGSGGRELGKRLADQLNVAYYDKEIIGKIAEKVQMDAHYIENVLERGYTQHYPYTFRRSFAFAPKPPNAYSTLLAEQAKIIRELAAKEDCVIVGRGANILLQKEKPFNLFVYADMPAKIARCRERASEHEHLSDRKLEQMIRKIDKDRASAYSLISGRVWGDRTGYHLCLNTTNMPIPMIVPHIAEYARLWFEQTALEERHG